MTVFPFREFLGAYQKVPDISAGSMPNLLGLLIVTRGRGTVNPYTRRIVSDCDKHVRRQDSSCEGVLAGGGGGQRLNKQRGKISRTLQAEDKARVGEVATLQQGSQGRPCREGDIWTES